MSAEDVEAKRGIAYTASADEAVGTLGDGADAVFLMRPTPVDQVRAVAAAGETMPPKSTYFYPKLLTGLVFNPVWSLTPLSSPTSVNQRLASDPSP